MYKLRDWIPEEKLDMKLISNLHHEGIIPIVERNLDKVCWKSLSANPFAMPLIEKYFDKIDQQILFKSNPNPNPAVIKIIEKKLDMVEWDWLSMYPAAIHLLETNIDKVYWYMLSKNPASIHLLERNIDEIDWESLLDNPNPEAIRLLEANRDKLDLDDLDWSLLSENPTPIAFHLLKENPDRIPICIFEYQSRCNESS